MNDLNTRLKSRWRPGHALVALEVLLAPSCTAIVGTLIGAPLAAVAVCLPQVAAAAWLERTRSGALISFASGIGWYLPLLGSAAVRGRGVDHSSAILGTVICLGVAMLAGRLWRSVEDTRVALESDDLTQLLNKRGFQSRLEAEANRSLRGGRPLTIAFLDCDDFKVINDTLGHAAGDQLLLNIARTLQQNVRNYDSVARMGGDEFAILFPEMPATQAQPTADRLLKAVQSNQPSQHRIVTISVGVVVFERPGTVQEMLAVADREMYAVKRSGKGRARIRVISPQDVDDSDSAA